jgi:hypothetical protein
LIAGASAVALALVIGPRLLRTPPPAAPADLRATTVSSSQIILGWSDSSRDEDGFTIERSADGAAFSPFATVAADVTSYDSTKLTAKTAYRFRVRAYKGKITSVYSNTAAVMTAAPAPSPPPDDHGAVAGRLLLRLPKGPQRSWLRVTVLHDGKPLAASHGGRRQPAGVRWPVDGAFPPGTYVVRFTYRRQRLPDLRVHLQPGRTVTIAPSPKALAAIDREPGVAYAGKERGSPVVGKWMVVATKQKPGRMCAAHVMYMLRKRTGREGGIPTTGDLKLAAEPAHARVYFYKGASMLRGVTTELVRECLPRMTSVTAFAPELPGRTQVQVPVKPNHVTTVRFIFRETKAQAP